jgi:hypothetical protein
MNIIAQVDGSGTEPVSDTPSSSENGGPPLAAGSNGAQFLKSALQPPIPRLTKDRRQGFCPPPSQVKLTESVNQPENPWLGSLILVVAMSGFPESQPSRLLCCRHGRSAARPHSRR